MSGFKLALCGILLSASSVVADDLVLSPSPPVVQRMVYYGSPTAVPQTAMSPIVVTQAAPNYAAPAPTANCCAPAAPATTAYYAPAPAPTTTSYYAPAPAQTTTYYAPAPAPVTSYYAPAPVAIAQAPLPVTTYYAPAVARPVVSYYGPAAVPVTTYYAPAAAVPVTTCYAPAAPVVVAPVGVVRSKVYYPGMPVRNFFKSITP